MTLRAQAVAIQFGARVAVSPTNCEFPPGEFVGLLGPNGAGKTSLIRGLAGLVQCSGTVFWRDREVADIPRQERARTLAYLPQSPEVHWSMTVRELASLGRLPHRRFAQAMNDADVEAVDQALVAANMLDHSERAIDELSGGERMRAQLARVLAVQAPVLLVDEPVANLDPAHQLLIMELLAEYAVRGGCVIAVMHDLTLAARYCRRVVLMHEGTIAGDGEPASVLSETALANIYGIRAMFGHHGGGPLIVPWTRSV
jgi:iron complex transport system ATP-binding protein